MNSICDSFPFIRLQIQQQVTQLDNSYPIELSILSIPFLFSLPERMMKSIGKLTYSPRSHLGSNERWLVLMCDDEISKYYRHMYAKEYPYLNQDRSTKLTRPVWGTHISVIRGEKISNMTKWGMEANSIIEFEYEPGVMDNGEYYWLKAKCPYLSELRVRYGLSREPRFGFHLTIGRTTE